MNPALTIKKALKEFGFFILEGLAPLVEKNRVINKAVVKKILVYAGGSGLGDLIRVLPAIETLHANFPTASISLLATPESQGILSLSPVSAIISEIINYDSKKRHKSFFKKIILLYNLRKKNYDLIYFPSRGGGMREEVLMNLVIGAHYSLGFKKGKVGLFSTTKIELREDMPILQQNLAILKAANLEIYDEEIRLEVPEKYIKYAHEFLSEHNLNNSFPLISIHTGASWYTKYRCWPIERYVSLIEYLLKDFNAKIIIIGSTNEAEMGTTICEQFQGSSVMNMVGKTDIGQMAALIKQSDLFIGHDSGPLHIALALKVPSIAIFGLTSPRQVISSTERCKVVSKNLSCSPCYLHQPGFKPYCEDLRCLKEITAEEVVECVGKMLTEIRESTML